MNMTNFKYVAIVGCGLLGGSFALSLRRTGLIGRIMANGDKRSPQLTAPAIETLM